jgi:hypothetical protein
VMRVSTKAFYHLGNFMQKAKKENLQETNSKERLRHTQHN